jgi:hypothetical protein
MANLLQNINYNQEDGKGPAKIVIKNAILKLSINLSISKRNTKSYNS